DAADASTTVWAWDSTAFGVGVPSVQTVKFNLRFPGQYYDELTKQHYNHNRYYNPALGRYVEPDPIGLEGGLNPYIYADGNPVDAIDPSGLYAYVNSKGEWVENGQNFYSASGGDFTDRIAYNFADDVITLAPLPKLGFTTKIDELFKLADLSVDIARVNKNTLSQLYVLEKNMPKILPESGLTFQDAGKNIIKWGSRPNDALLRSMFMTPYEAKSILKQIPENDIKTMRDFYIRIANLTPKDKVLVTPTPLTRAALMNNILKLAGK
ncbi:RHS repeat-associated core domain-containing protein, partial [Acinetobacter gyllenbergii]